MITLGDTAGPAGPSPDDPGDAVDRIPHPAVLVGGSLAFLTVAASLGLARVVHLTGWTASALVLLGMAVVTALTAATLLTLRRAQSMPAALVGLVLLDAAPVTLQFAAIDPNEARARVVFLLIPTVLAACSLAAAAHWAHLSGVSVLAAVMVALPAGGRTVLDRVFEVAVTVGVLLAADLLVRRLSGATAERIFQLRRLSLTDGLTGVLNRRGLSAGFRSLLRGPHVEPTVGVLIADIDHFKWFNDEYGHAAGDDVLRRVCQALAATAGPGSLVARTGGEEVAALVTGRIEPVAEAFRAALARMSPPVTVSIGVIDVDRSDCTPTGALWQILDAADRALYEAKNTGRNRICRATLQDADPRPPAPAPARHPAAVPAPDVVTALPQPPRGGSVLAVFGVAGIVSALGRDPAPLSDGLDWVLLAASAAALAAGLSLAITATRRIPARLLWCMLACDLLVALAVLDAEDQTSKVTLLLPLAATGLVVAQYFPRGMVVAHHAVVGVVCVLVFGGGVSILALAAVLLHAAVLIGSAELIYWQRQRHVAAADDLHRWSVTDPLTGLANRRGLELAFASMARSHDVTILALDVDDFKAVNDRHGHAVGDDTLIRLAATLRTVTDAGSVVGRTGGDEFVLLVPSTHSGPWHSGTLTDKVARAAGLLPVPLSVSVGSTVVAPYQRLSLWQLVAAADAGLTRAKRARREALAGAAFDPERTLPIAEVLAAAGAGHADGAGYADGAGAAGAGGATAAAEAPGSASPTGTDG